ncbi:MAG: class I SAM-dependent methyltransferase [Candidatus Diapherotrites archaeon]
MISLIYWHPVVYRTTMNVLFALSNYNLKEEYKKIAEEVGSLSVLDLCCGDCYFKKFIPNNTYTGIDFNKTFIKWASKKGINAENRDVLKENLPSADCVVMLASLYHFLPTSQEAILQKMIDSAKKKVIISEPVENISSGQAGLFGKFLSNPGGEYTGQRFSREQLISLYKKFNASKIMDMGRTMIGVFEK